LNEQVNAAEGTLTLATTQTGAKGASIVASTAAPATSHAAMPPRKTNLNR
jgi:hypothetical protein